MPNMTAGLHADLASLFLENPLVEPGKLTRARHAHRPGQDRPGRLRGGRPHRPHHALGGLLPHRRDARRRQPVRAVSSSGHIQAIVNPPDNPKASYRAADDPGRRQPTPSSPGRSGSAGSWWVEWSEWLATRDGDRAGGPRDARHPEPARPRPRPRPLRADLPVDRPATTDAAPGRGARRSSATTASRWTSTVSAARVSVRWATGGRRPGRPCCCATGSAAPSSCGSRSGPPSAYPTIAFDAPGRRRVGACPPDPPTMTRLAARGPACSTTSASPRSTCSACRGAAPWPRSWPTAIPTGSGGWCCAPPAPAGC